MENTREKTQEMLGKVNALFSDRCIELVRQGRSDEAAKLHSLHRKAWRLVTEWQAEEAAKNG